MPLVTEALLHTAKGDQRLLVAPPVQAEALPRLHHCVDQQNHQRDGDGALPHALIAVRGDLQRQRGQLCVVEQRHGRDRHHGVGEKVDKHIEQHPSAVGDDDVDQNTQRAAAQSVAHGLQIGVEQLEVADGHHVGRAEEVHHVDDDENPHRVVQRRAPEEHGKGKTQRKTGDGKRPF